MRVLALLTCATLAACGGVRPAFDARLDAALAAPAPVDPVTFAPDARVTLAPDVLRDAVAAGLDDAHLDAHVALGPATVSVTLGVRDLRIVDVHGACTRCVGVEADLSGRLGLGGFGGAVGAPVQAEARLDVALDAAPARDGFALTATVVEVADVEVVLGGRVPVALGRLPLGPVSAWLRQALVDAVPPLHVARVGTAGLPVQAARVAGSGGRLALELRTKAPVDAAVHAAPREVDEGFSLRVATASVLALVRAELFRRGPVADDVWVDPTSLRIERDRFTLGVRLWRPGRAAWWRDLEVLGTVRASATTIALDADLVTQVDASPGAKAIDPLVAVAKARVLDDLARTLRLTLPASRTGDLGAVEATWRLRTLATEGDDLVVTGTVRLK